MIAANPDPMTHPGTYQAARDAEALVLKKLAGNDDRFATAVGLTVRYAAHAIKAQEDKKTGGACIEHLLKFFSDPSYQAEVLLLHKDQATGKWAIQAPLDEEVRRFFEHAYYGVWDKDTRQQTAISATNALLEATKNHQYSRRQSGTILPAEQRTSGYFLSHDKDPMNDGAHPASAADSTARFVRNGSGIHEEYFLEVLTPIIRNAAAAVKSYEECYLANRATTPLLELFFANPDYRSNVLDTIAGRKALAPKPPSEQLTPHSSRLDQTTTCFFDERFYGYYTPDQQLAYLWYCKSVVANALYESEAEVSPRRLHRETIGEG